MLDKNILRKGWNSFAKACRVANKPSKRKAYFCLRAQAQASVQKDRTSQPECLDSHND